MNTISKFLFIFFITAATMTAQTTWSFDKSHTEVGFTVTHLVITEVDGRFNEFEGSVTTDGDNFENAKLDFTINTNSINTENEKRDNHLRSDDFFNAEEFPTITFTGKSMTKVSDNMYKLVGDLTMRSTTKEVELDVKFNGIVQDPWGNTKAGFKITGSVNRFDYGLKWNAAIETGGLVVGEDVELEINIQLKKEA